MSCATDFLRRITGTVLVLVVVVLGWLIVANAASAEPPVGLVQAHGYDVPDYDQPTTYTATQRGPPAAYVSTAVSPGQRAVDRPSYGALARSDAPSNSNYPTNDVPASLAQVDNSTGTTARSAVAIGGGLSSLQRARAAANSGAGNFVGRKGVTKFFDDGSSASYGGEIKIARGTNAPGVANGRSYSGHAFDQMQGRGITPSVVDDAIGSGVISRGADGSRIFYSSGNNLSVVVNSDGRVITVGYGAFKPR